MKTAFYLSLLLNMFLLGIASAADGPEARTYGSIDFDASGSPEAHEVFIRGLLQLHNFEYDDARASFLAAQELDADFAMAYWGEALTHEHPLWSQHAPEAGRAVLARLGDTAQERAAKFPTEREKAYLHSIELLFGEGSQEERELRYSAALGEIHADYPDDLDAAALYALSLLTISHGGRDFALYMRAGATTEEILDINPRHPGALHYAIHSYDDPIHAPLGLRAANLYAEVAPSAVHALHMGSHIYFALGMWELGIERNTRAFEEAVARQSSPDDSYGNQANHALIWLIYALNQQGLHEEAAAKLALFEDQLSRYGGNTHRQNFIAARASYLVDTQDWDSHFATIRVDYDGLNHYFVATDEYIQGMIALKNADVEGAKAALLAIGGAEPVQTRSRRAMVPRLLHLALQGQLELAAGNTDRALALMEEAAELEASVPPEYGPAVPVQPTAELLADTYLSLGEVELARENYELALKGSVGRERSLTGLSEAAH
ncbi:MAG: hypothetical protein V3T47_07575 [Gammaproteobacteria bacterium]